MEYVDPIERFVRIKENLDRYNSVGRKLRDMFAAATKVKTEKEAKRACVSMLSTLDGMKMLLDTTMAEAEQIPDDLYAEVLPLGASKDKALGEIRDMISDISIKIAYLDKRIQINSARDKEEGR